MAQIRIGHDLCDDERECVAKRKTNNVQQWLQRNHIECTEEEVPNIALLGSGGGERAMVGLLGSLYQMGKDQTDLLDSISYLSGVSGSTWCMASLYEQKNWSSKLESMKQQIVRRIGHDSVSILKRGEKLISYYHTRDNFSLTHVWAAMVVPEIVKAMNDHSLSSLQSGYEKDPYPIYTAIDQDSKYASLTKDAWFELTPHEAGYSVTGAFVETSSFGCRFNKGSLVKKQPEMDMLYIQGLCSSVLADIEVILKWIEAKADKKTMKANPGLKVLHSLVKLNLHVGSGKDWSSAVKELNKLLKGKKHLNGHDMKIKKSLWKKSGAKIVEHSLNHTLEVCETFFHWYKHLENDPWVVVVKSIEKVVENKRDFSLYLADVAPTAAHDKEELLKAVINKIKIETSRAENRAVHQGHRLLHLMVELNLQIVKMEDWTVSLKKCNKLLEGKRNLMGRDMKISKSHWLKLAAKDRERHALQHTLDVCQSFFNWFQDLENGNWKGIVDAIMKLVKYMMEKSRIWGTTYNFLYNMQAPEVDQSILGESMRHFEDAGLLLNSPYLSVSRPERKVGLIISLDFNKGNPMETVVNASKTCKEMGIPFPSVDVSNEDPNAPKDFYVFKGYSRAPTVIHMPLFNINNCGDHTPDWWQSKYTTFQLAYGPEMIDELVEKAGENIRNNKDNLLKEIKEIIQQKREPVGPAATQ